MSQIYRIWYELDNPDDLDPWWLYVIKCGPYFKIGIAIDCKDRLKALQTGNPFKLSIIKTRSVPKMFVQRLERHIHRQLKDVCHRSEWFNTSFSRVKEVIKEAGNEQNKWRREYIKRVTRREPIFNSEILLGRKPGGPLGEAHEI